MMPITDIILPALSIPEPVYIVGFARYTVNPLFASTTPIIPQMRPTKKHPKSKEQMPSTNAATALGAVCC